MKSSFHRPLSTLSSRAALGLLLTCMTLGSPAVAAPAPGAHAHGVAELRVAIDGEQLEISLESPLDNVLGFERAPRTDKERAAVRAMAAKLRHAQALFVPTAAAQCSLTSVQLSSAALSADLLGEPKVAVEVKKDEDGHADLDASFSFKCAAPLQLKGMEVALMLAFPNLRKLNVQVVGPKGQSALLLTPGKRMVAW